jgi:hypothetical protein
VDDDRVALTILCAMLRAAERRWRRWEAERRAGPAPQARYDFWSATLHVRDGRLERCGGCASRAACERGSRGGHHRASSYDNRRDAQRAGFQDLVTKPVEATALVELVLKLARP